MEIVTMKPLTSRIRRQPPKMRRFCQTLLFFSFAFLMWNYYSDTTRSLLAREHGQRSKEEAGENNSKNVHLQSRHLLNYCVGGSAAACVPPLHDFITGYQVANKYRLVACAISKNFSTVLMAIFCFLFDESRFLRHNRNLTSEHYETRLCAGVNEYDYLSSIYDDFKLDLNTWSMITVVRNPFERFVSGFADKCLREQIWRQFPSRCNGCKTNLTCFIERQYERMMHWKGGPHPLASFDDHHFFPQNWFCNINSLFNRYHILKFDTANPSKLIDELAKILRKHHVPESSIEYIKTSVSAARTVHKTLGTVEQKKTRQTILNNKYLMDLLIKMYFYDFILFGFPFPEFNITNQ